MYNPYVPYGYYSNYYHPYPFNFNNINYRRNNWNSFIGNDYNEYPNQNWRNYPRNRNRYYIGENGIEDRKENYYKENNFRRNNN